VRRARDLPGYLRDTVLRMLPHATRPGLYPIGAPGPDAPVLCTGNFTLTVRRMKDALAGHDAWLLVANSRGINVWCAAGGGHLTHHDVIAALRSSGIAERVDHRTLVLPQLGATGIERARVADATGWKPVWGPARLEDVPGFLERGLKVKKPERAMRFPAWERLEMAAMWAVPMALIAALVLWLVAGAIVAAAAAAAIVASVAGLFAALPWLRVTGHLRWLTHAAFTAAGVALGAGLLALAGHADPGGLLGIGIASAVTGIVLAADLAGTTPWYPSTLNSIGNHFDIELVEDRCTGAADCVLVCPREVLVMNGRRRKVEIARPEQCIRCGACIVQCPSDALQFRFADGRVAEPATIRSTRLNLLGKRSIEVAPAAAPARRSDPPA
jgi:NAD-dependent dihydropyrimidine dehydrogenase PreA subunit